MHLKVCGAEDIHIAANQSQQVVESDSVNCVKWGPTVSSAGAARRNHSQLPALCVPIGRAPSVSAKRVIFVRSFWFRGGYQGRHNGGGRGNQRGARASGAKLRGTEMGRGLRTSGVRWISEERDMWVIRRILMGDSLPQTGCVVLRSSATGEHSAPVAFVVQSLHH